MGDQTVAERYQEQGYDVTMRGESLVLDTPNPDVTGDDYFHGANPHTVGFSSHGLAAEGGGLDLEVQHNDGAGEATADVQNRNENAAGWHAAGEAESTAGHAHVAPGGGPDESWTNARIRAYADENGIDVGDASTKAQLLEAVRG